MANISMQNLPKCMVCGKRAHTRYIDLYVVGSEGLHICSDCEMQIDNYVMSMIQFAGRVKMAQHLSQRELEP